VAWENMKLHVDDRFSCLTLNSLHLINYCELRLENKSNSTLILHLIDFCLGCDAYHKAFHNGGFLARYPRQFAYMALYLMRKERDVVS
jgi:hypothetical protein